MAKSKYGIDARHCLKCGGNIYLDSDEHGQYEHCLQCGYTRDLDSMVTAGSNSQEDKAE